MDIMLERILECIGPTHGAIKELAQHLGVVPNVITNWKNGSSKSYRKYIRQIAEFYDVSADWLAGESDNKKDLAGSGEVTEDDLKFALFGGEATDKQLDEVRRFAQFIKERDAT